MQVNFITSFDLFLEANKPIKLTFGPHLSAYRKKSLSLYNPYLCCNIGKYLPEKIRQKGYAHVRSSKTI